MSKRNELQEFPEPPAAADHAADLVIDWPAPAITLEEVDRVLEASAEWVEPDDDDLGAAESFAVYDEYLQMLDQLPVLSDVVREPPKVVIRDFRLGQRPDLRKTPREDPYTLLEQQTADLEERYREYAELCANGSAPKPTATKRTGTSRKPKQKRKGAKRRKR